MSEKKGTINLGLCCINTQLRKKGIFNSRNVIRRTFSIDRAKKLALENIKDLIPMIEYNNKNNIKCFRWSSDIFPHFTDSELEKYTIDFASEELKKAGDLANKYGQRIVMHPGQYNQVGANKISVFEKTNEDLTHHANILDKAGINENGVIIVHGGGIYGDKENTKRRWIDQFDDLSRPVKNRLVIENCEHSYSIRDVLDISQECKICADDTIGEFEKIEKPKEFMEEVIESWKDRKMLCHVSSQGEGRIGHHADYIKFIPKHILKLHEAFNVNIDLEVEAKMKEQAIFDLVKKYPEHF